MAKYTILIADDEEIERKALCLLLQKEFPEIGIVAVACNGTELVAMLQQHQPDIAIVDVNMPGINGIDAIDLLRAKGSKTHFIINTAYDDFAFVQRALSLKIDAYILKPEKRDTTIQTIRKLCQQIDMTRENSHSQQQIHALFTRVHSVLESEIMYSLFIGEPAQENFETYCEMHGIRFEAGTVASLIPVLGSRSLGQNKSALRAVLDEALGNSCAYLASVTEANICLLLFVEKDTIQEQRHWISDVLGVTISKISRTLNLSLRAGVGGVYSKFEQMAAAYQESLLALMTPTEDWISFCNSQNAAQNADAEILVCQLREGNLTKINTELSRMRLPLQNNPPLAGALWQSVCEALQEEAAAIPGFGEQLARTAADIEERPPQADPVPLLQEGLFRLLERMGTRNAVSDNTYVGQALRYIEEHYAEDISLDVVAEQIGISSFYLSRLFKVERGESFVEYLTSVRMKVAVRLARETRLSIKEIAARTGYTSPTYFCRVFKKYTGSTIGDMREQIRKKQF
ncbi:MAG: response regulator [Faecousia sp.]